MMVYHQTKRMKLRKAQMRSQILQAARILFSKNGYNATSMNRIVSEACTSIGNCYYYFPNKESLLLEIVKEDIAQIWEFSEEIPNIVLSGVMKLSIVLYKVSMDIMDNEEKARLFIIGNSIPMVRMAMFKDFITRLMHIVEADTDLFKGMNIELEFYAAYGAVIALVERKRMGEIHMASKEITFFLIRWTLKAIGISHNNVEDTLSKLKQVTSNFNHDRK